MLNFSGRIYALNKVTLDICDLLKLNTMHKNLQNQKLQSNHILLGIFTVSGGMIDSNKVIHSERRMYFS